MPQTGLSIAALVTLILKVQAGCYALLAQALEANQGNCFT